MGLVNNRSQGGGVEEVQFDKERHIAGSENIVAEIGGYGVGGVVGVHGAVGCPTVGEL